MKFEDSKYYKILKHQKVEKPFGNFYFLDQFAISEIHEGVHFNYQMIDIISEEVIKFYNDFKKQNPKKLIYITNKINSYSLDPNSWIKTEAKYGIAYTRAIVNYNSWSHTNAAIEKMFSKANIKCCHTLDEAIEWAICQNE
ncbi:hypothetical protein [Hwangdonia lutea]|uniref:STAS/SEC14 domain-containing protein n=1 Tax=Hwangdonia lutea TaxID=3075823 RepID=A0AA97HQT1_9FLAO|nr:hypothetical protein [Hwangdonia sp. SCSIO 19198]WOD43048.1 hypothetical protein RNZ46_13730 [Hwangdonia sp. SCSIO 19198]